MKVLDAALWTVTALLGAVVAAVAVELTFALGASVCPGGPGCYPWGAEGPAAESWRYASKATYLASGAAAVLLVASVALLMVTTRANRSAFARALAVAGLAGAAVLLWA